MFEKYSSVIRSIKTMFDSDSGGHDWFHLERVCKNALAIQKKEGGEVDVVFLLALTHDISDHKLNGGKLYEGGKKAETFLQNFPQTSNFATRVGALVDEISYRGAGVADTTTCIESKIVQDADRLDAIGAIGIARAFAFGGSRNRPLFDPAVLPTQHQQFEEYARSKSHTINHFYEKLLLIRDRLHTPTAREMAVTRHEQMLTFLDAFYAEWQLEGVFPSENLKLY